MMSRLAARTGRSAALVLLVATLPAQQRFDELARPALPWSIEASGAVALADFDGDGDLDAWLTARYPRGPLPHRLLLNDGLGRFTDASAARIPPGATHSAAAVGVADFDGDGDLDVVVAYDRGQQNRLYLNAGQGFFVDATTTNLPVDVDESSSLAIGDVDGDGDLDVVLGDLGAGANGRNRLYLNDGTARFTEHSAARFPAESDSTEAVALTDVDSDGDLDLILANWRTQNALWLNDGTGRFAVATATQLPTDQDTTTSVAVGDVDGDGDPDLLFGNASNSVFPSAPPDPDRLYLNDGTGRFTDASATRLPRTLRFTSAVGFVDVDADGDLDVLLGQTTARERLYVNDGTGHFVDETDARVPDAEVATSALAFGDVDGDGHVDVLAGPGIPVRLWVNDAAGHFVDASAPRLPPVNRARPLALGDVDADGDVDVVAGIGYGDIDRLFRNDGNGRFRDVTNAQMPAAAAFTEALALGDVDGDGDLDIVGASGGTGMPGGEVWLLRNDGRGDYQDETTGWRLLVRYGPTAAIALGDVDGDGDLDLVRASGALDPGWHWPNPSQIHLNDGTGDFGPLDAGRTFGGWYTAVALGDVDGDGDLDIVTGGRSGLYVNDGTGTFTQDLTQQLPFGGAIALADADGDGDLDLFSGGEVVPGGPVHLGLNDGAGRFVDATVTHMPAGTWYVRALAAFDVDEDGDVDLVVGNSQQPMLLFENDGSGHFTDVSATSLPSGTPIVDTLAVADVDGDGDLDVVGAFDEGTLHVLVDLRRQLDIAWSARPGGTLGLDVYARHATPNTIDVALPFLSAGAAAIPLPPFGTLRIDPTRAIALPPAIVPRPAGVVPVQVAVPNNPSLAGVAIHAQAMLLTSPGSARLTNAAVEVLRR